MHEERVGVALTAIGLATMILGIIMLSDALQAAPLILSLVAALSFCVLASGAIWIYRASSRHSDEQL